MKTARFPIGAYIIRRRLEDFEAVLQTPRINEGVLYGLYLSSLYPDAHDFRTMYNRGEINIILASKKQVCDLEMSASNVFIYKEAKKTNPQPCFLFSLL